MNIFKKIYNKLFVNSIVTGSFDLNDSETYIACENNTNSINQSKDKSINNSVFINEVKNWPDLAKSYLFTVEFNFNNDELNKMSEKLKLRCNGCSISPLTNYSTKNEISLEFDAFEDMDDYMLWYNMIKGGSIDNHVKSVDLTIKLYNSELLDVIATFNYKNCILKSISGLDLDMKSSGHITYTLLFDCAITKE